MKKLLTLVAVVAILPLAGCLTMKNELVVKSNGSGEMKIDINLDTELIDQIKQMSGGEMDMGEMDEIATKKGAEKLAKEKGCELVSHEVKEEDGRKKIKTHFKADDYKKLDVMGDEDGETPFKFYAGKKKGTGVLVLGMDAPDEMDEGLGGLDEYEEEQKAMIIAMIKQFTADLLIEFKVTLPGKIIETDLKKEGDNTVHYAIDLREWETLEDLSKKFKTHRVVFDASQLTFKLDAEPKKEKPAEKKTDDKAAKKEGSTSKPSEKK